MWQDGRTTNRKDPDMNLRRVIRFSSAFVVWLLSATTAGIVLFIADEAFRWDLLPDWLERIAGVLLSAVGLIAACGLVACLTASMALVALSIGDRGGAARAEEEARARKGRARRWGWAAAALAVVVGGGFALQKADEWRGKRIEAARREQHKVDYFATRDVLEGQVAFLSGKFPAELADAAASGDAGRAREVAELLASFQASTRFSPEVSLAVRAEEPYAWARLEASGRGTACATGRCEPKPDDGEKSPLSQTPFVTLPSRWERDTVAALFKGAELEVPHGRTGALIDTREPCVWRAVRGTDGNVKGLLVLRTKVQQGLAKEK
jgi:hypothetical protein